MFVCFTFVSAVTGFDTSNLFNQDYYMMLFTEITRCKTDRYDFKNVLLAFIAISLITKYFKSSASTQPLKNREKFCSNRIYFCLSIELNKNVFALRRRDQ
jgi:hypothetical protein